ncbi:MAG: SIR2 family NAD-dependent protein deacylase [Promethearchaeota archaeon]
MKYIDEEEFNEHIEKARRIISESNNVIIFTGAGISTESGIPDFRSPGGLWTVFDPDIYANYNVFLRDPSKYWELERYVTKMLKSARPNAAHIAIAEFEKTNKLRGIITQNIDMLHQRAGSGVKCKIYELHGSAIKSTCKSCGNVIDRERLLEKMEKEDIPRCDICGNVIKPDVVLFNEPLPPHVLEEAIEELDNCDCFIMIGSSLLVSPANFLPEIAKKNGAKLIFVNLEPTFFDYMADVTIYGKASVIVPKILEVNNS